MLKFSQFVTKKYDGKYVNYYIYVGTWLNTVCIQQINLRNMLKCH